MWTYSPASRWPRRITARTASARSSRRGLCADVVRFLSALVRGTLVRRYKRFLSDVDLDDGQRVVAHCANPGSLIGLAEPGAEVWLSPNRNPKAQLDWRWDLRSEERRVGKECVSTVRSWVSAYS